MPKTRGRLLVTIVAAAAMVLTLLPLGVAPAGAVAPVDSPTNLTPADEAETQGNPVLGWDALEDAVRYRVQVDDQATFASPIHNELTYGTTFTPWVELPADVTLYWRVAAVNAASETGPYASRTFTKRLAAPSGLSPANGIDLDFPEDPPTFTWNPLPSTKSYVLEVDDADDFNGAQRIVTRNTSYTLTEPQPSGQRYYWRVRGSSNTGGTGVLSPWTATRNYDLAWSDQPTHVVPAPNSSVTDIELAWDPVPGATAYNVLIDLDEAFTSPPTVTATNVHSTRYTWRDSLPNSAYWWKVQPVDAEGNLGLWSAPQVFTRNWPAAPELVEPAAEATTSGDLRLEWRTDQSTPTDPPATLRHASSYELQLANDANFSVNVDSCLTVQTSIYLGAKCENRSGAFYWRVRGLDAPANIQGIWSPTRHHASHTPRTTSGQFDPAVQPAFTAPANCDAAGCASRAMPTLSWQPVSGANRYYLFVALDPAFTSLVGEFRNGGLLLGVQTTYSPIAELPDNDAAGSYYWYVKACNTLAANGPVGCTADPVSANPVVNSRAFKKNSTPVQRLDTSWQTAVASPTAAVAHYPRFEWQDYLDTTSNDPPDPGLGTTDLEARQYQVQVSTVSTFASLIDDKTVDQTFYSPWDRTYPEGPLFWRVRAIDGSRNNLAWSAGATQFQKVSPKPIQVLPVDGASVETVPRFTWNELDFAALYEYEVYRNADQAFSTANRVLSVRTAHTMHRPKEALPVGSYTWRIRRVDADNRVGAWSHEAPQVGVPHVKAPTFTVDESQFDLNAPGDGARLTNNDIVFNWDPVGRASSYRFERSASSTMSSPIGSRVTPMVDYAPTEKIANGRWYWRVSALDADGNVIARSLVGNFVKADPPAAGSVYLAITPCRIMDSREGTGANAGKYAIGATRDIQVTGTGAAFAQQGGQPGGCQIPAGATAVEASVTAVSPEGAGYFRAWPSNVSPPNATFLNYSSGQSLTNTGAITLARTGTKQLRTGNYAARSHYVIDIQGYFVDRDAVAYGALFVPTTPCRVVDTRQNSRLGPNEERGYQLAGSGAKFAQQGGRPGGCGIPDGVSAVAASVSAIEPNGGGFLRVWPSNVAPPNATFLNFSNRQSTTNTGAIALAPTGLLDVKLRNYAGKANHFAIDVQGYYIDRLVDPSGAAYVAVTPCRVVDTRAKAGSFKAGQERAYQVAGTGSGFVNQGGQTGGCGIPDGVAAVAATVSAVAPRGFGYFRARPANLPAPNATFLNYSKGKGITNTGALALAPTGAQDLRVQNFASTADYVIDVQGYYHR